MARPGRISLCGRGPRSGHRTLSRPVFGPTPTEIRPERATVLWILRILHFSEKNCYRAIILIIVPDFSRPPLSTSQDKSLRAQNVPNWILFKLGCARYGRDWRRGPPKGSRSPWGRPPEPYFTSPEGGGGHVITDTSQNFKAIACGIRFDCRLWLPID